MQCYQCYASKKFNFIFSKEPVLDKFDDKGAQGEFVGSVRARGAEEIGGVNTKKRGNCSIVDCGVVVSYFYGRCLDIVEEEFKGNVTVIKVGVSSSVLCFFGDIAHASVVMTVLLVCWQTQVN
jgi:hypothetical protein